MNPILEAVFGPSQPVAVTVLGQDGPPLAGTVVEMTGPAIRVRTTESLATGTAVKIEGAGTILLADVNFCDPVPGGSVVGLTARHMLTALAGLTRLGRALREEQALAAAAHKTA